MLCYEKISYDMEVVSGTLSGITIPQTVEVPSGELNKWMKHFQDLVDAETILTSCSVRSTKYIIRKVWEGKYHV